MMLSSLENIKFETMKLFKKKIKHAAAFKSKIKIWNKQQIIILNEKYTLTNADI